MPSIISTTTLQPAGIIQQTQNLLNPNFIQSEWTGNFDSSGNGNTGYPIIRNNVLTFSFAKSSVSHIVNNLPVTSGYNLSFDIQTYTFGPNGYGGYLQITIDFLNSNNAKVGSIIYGNISTPIPSYSQPTTLTATTTQDVSSATSCIITITGKDNAYWLGFYGPTISNIKLIPNISQIAINPINIR
jgi:hypothetical protein